MLRRLMMVVALGALACGDSTGEVREWRATDHAHPDQIGEGQAAPGGPISEERAVAMLWTSMCATCHGEEGHGDGPGRAPGMQVRNLADPAWQESVTDEAMSQVIDEGRGLMPRFGNQINDDGIRALVRYIRQLDN